MCFDTTVEAPAPTQQEIELQEFQLEELRRASEFEQQIIPLIFEDLGYVLDEETGEYVLTEEAARLDELGGEFTTLQLEQGIAALKGELPVSPGLERGITKAGENLEARLLKDLGTGFATSSPGIEALAEQAGVFEGLRFDVGRGIISDASARDLAAQSVGAATGAATAGTLGATVGLPLSVAGAISGPLSLYQGDRALQLSASAASAQNNAMILSSLFGAAGTGLGLAVGLSR